MRTEIDGTADGLGGGRQTRWDRDRARALGQASRPIRFQKLDDEGEPERNAKGQPKSLGLDDILRDLLVERRGDRMGSFRLSRESEGDPPGRTPPIEIDFKLRGTAAWSRRGGLCSRCVPGIGRSAAGSSRPGPSPGWRARATMGGCPWAGSRSVNPILRVGTVG